jgi:hypothetical protein
MAFAIAGRAGKSATQTTQANPHNLTTLGMMNFRIADLLINPKQLASRRLKGYRACYQRLRSAR